MSSAFGSADDKNLTRKTNPILCRVLAQSLQHLPLHFTRLFLRELGNLSTKRVRHLRAQGPEVFHRERCFDLELKHALGWSSRAGLGKNRLQLAARGKAECVGGVGCGWRRIDKALHDPRQHGMKA